MKKILAILSSLLFTIPNLASAHTSTEHAGGFWSVFLHLITEPDHIFIVGSIAILGYGVALQRRPKAKAANVPRETAVKG